MASSDITTSSGFKTGEIFVGILILLVIIEGVLFFSYCSIQLWKGTWVWPQWKVENRVDIENTHRNDQSDSEMEVPRLN
jgi:hypothetical protein